MLITVDVKQYFEIFC